MRATQLKAGMRLRRTSGWALVRSVRRVVVEDVEEVCVALEHADAPRYPVRRGWCDAFAPDDDVTASAPQDGDLVASIKRRAEHEWTWAVETRGGYTLGQGGASSCHQAERDARACRDGIRAEASRHAAPQAPLGVAEALAGLLRAVDAYRIGKEAEMATATGMTLDEWQAAARWALAVGAAVHATEPRPFCED